MTFQTQTHPVFLLMVTFMPIHLLTPSSRLTCSVRHCPKHKPLSAKCNQHQPSHGYATLIIASGIIRAKADLFDIKGKTTALGKGQLMMCTYPRAKADPHNTPLYTV